MMLRFLSDKLSETAIQREPQFYYKQRCFRQNDKATETVISVDFDSLTFSDTRQAKKHNLSNEPEILRKKFSNSCRFDSPSFGNQHPKGLTQHAHEH